MIKVTIGKVIKDSVVQFGKGAEKGSILPQYRKWILMQIERNNLEVINELRRLRNKSLTEPVRLACYCAPSPCHGDIIKEIIEDDNINLYKTVGGNENV